MAKRKTNDRGPAISAGLAASQGMTRAEYLVHRKSKRAEYEKSRRARIKALRVKVKSGRTRTAGKVLAEGGE